MDDITYEQLKRTGYCRGCDKEIKADTEKVIKTWSFRNRGMHIIICDACVDKMFKLKEWKC